MAETEDPDKRRWQFRFTSGSMFLVTLIVAILAAGASYLFRSMRGGDDRWQMLFFPLVLVTPLGLVVFLSILMSVIRWMKTPRR